MPYSTVTNVTNYSALLGYLATFISGLSGWTIDLNLTTPTVDSLTPPTPPAVGGKVLAAHNTAGVNFCLRSTDTGNGANCLYLFDAYGTTPFTADGPVATGSGRQAALGYTSNSVTSANATVRGFQQLVGPYPSLFMFSDDAGDYVHIVLEWQSGKFRHLHLGSLKRYGTWTGGQYYAPMFWNQGGLNTPNNPNPISYASSNAHELPWDNGNNGAQGWSVHYPSPTGDSWIGGSSDSTYGGVMNRAAYASLRGGFNRAFKNIIQSSFSGLVPLAPIIVGAVRSTDSPNTIRFIGEVPDVRMVNMTNLSDLQEFAIGTDTWKVFSVASKNGAAGQENSGVMGFAYKKITT